MVSSSAGQRSPHRFRSLAGLGLLGLLLVCVVLSITVGSEPIAAGTAVRALLEHDGSHAAVIVRELRMPRTMLGVCVGLALGTAGAIMQALTRNPLADPGILGVNAGAATGVVLVITVLGLNSFTSYVWFALLGAGAAAVLVYLVGWPGNDVVRLALGGTAITAALSALNQTLVFLDPEAFDEYRFWVVGDLAGRSAPTFASLIPFLAVGMVLALSLAPALNVLALGEDTSRSLGSRPGITRASCALAVLLLSGSATAAAGPIAFVGLVVPHIARAVCGPDQRFGLAYSALLGACLVVASDVLGRTIAPEGELRVGIVVAIVGAPVFVMLVRRVRIVRP